jgi:hypothetical protein
MMIDVTYTFRNPENSRQFNYLAPSLQKMFYLLCHILNDMQYDVIITSMVRPPDTVKDSNGNVTESGVHATGRALDCVPMKRSNVKSVQTSVAYDQEMKIVADCVNKMLPRQDGKSTLIWHQVNGGGGLHFHIQVPWGPLFKDLKGVVPSTDA